MRPMKCDLCDQPAAIHETVVDQGNVTMRHLCRDHGAPIWHEAAAPLDTPERRAAFAVEMTEYQKDPDAWLRKHGIA